MPDSKPKPNSCLANPKPRFKTKISVLDLCVLLLNCIQNVSLVCSTACSRNVSVMICVLVCCFWIQILHTKIVQQCCLESVFAMHSKHLQLGSLCKLSVMLCKFGSCAVLAAIALHSKLLTVIETFRCEFDFEFLV